MKELLVPLLFLIGSFLFFVGSLINFIKAFNHVV